MGQQDKIRRLSDNIGIVVKGKPEAIQISIVALLARGHLLIEDVPGVGKTTLAQSMARSLNCSFRRIQFTSDLLPSDILGVSIFNQAKHEFEFRHGPLFANIVLADEINRTTPKTQSSLLEAMNDTQVSVDSRTYPLPRPFMVIATQNPLEHQGTYPLPESQLDRFMIRMRLGYPSESDEREILLSQKLYHPADDLGHVLSGDEILELQRQVDTVRMDRSLVDYILAIISATRRSEMLGLGTSTRGGMFLYKAAQALAFVEGRGYCVPDDIKYLAPYVLAHRVIPTHRFDPHGGRAIDAERIIHQLLDEIPVPL